MIGESYTGQILFTESLVNLTAARRTMLMDRESLADDFVSTTVAGIIRHVRSEGDRALIAMARDFDGAELEALEVPRTAWRTAVDSLDRGLLSAMERTIRNIESVQRAFLPARVDVSPEPGILVSRRADPLDRVGVYAPGGRAAYPSSVLMGAIPARVAGVPEIVLCSPPGPNALPSTTVLAAAELAGVQRVFAIGGAGAVAAMAYGTQSVPRVDRIVGPGNAYVAAAKLQVAGVVGIDSPAGPSELLVIADSAADTDVIVRELLAQAEHDPRAIVVVIAIGEKVAESILDRLTDALQAQQRRDIIAESLRRCGAVLWTSDMDQAVAFSNDFAPEHLLLAVRDATSLVPRLRNAGTIFVGEASSVTFGDYMTGANHVLPTGGLARSYSGLSVLDFMRWTTTQTVDSAAAARLAGDVGIFADAEGLPAHAAAARQWGLDGVES